MATGWWYEYAETRSRSYQETHSVSVAPVWWAAKTPWQGLRMWASEQVRLKGTRLVERFARMVWP